MDNDEPEAYIIGWQPFLGLKIYLDSKPLIPRPETEWWTEQLLAELTSRSSAESFSVALRVARPSLTTENDSADSRHIQFLDLCAGSGAIGCAALAKLRTRQHDDASNVQVYFGEIDPAHEATILRNIRENHLDESRAHICIGDLFQPFPDMRFDIIAANPPYVPSGRVLPASVADYEPPLALLAGEEGLDVTRRIAHDLPQYLAKDGIAWVECDRGHAEAARKLFEEQGFNTEIRTDQYGRPRLIVVSFPT